MIISFHLFIFRFRVDPACHWPGALAGAWSVTRTGDGRAAPGTRWGKPGHAGNGRRGAAGCRSWPPARWWPAGPEAEAGGETTAPTPGAKWHQGRRRVRTAVAVALATAGGSRRSRWGGSAPTGAGKAGQADASLVAAGGGAERGGNMGTAKATGAWARRARCRAARGGVVARSTTSGGEGKRRPRASPWVAEDGATGVEEGVADDAAKKRQAGGEEEAGRRCSSATSCSGRRRTASGGGDRRRRGGGARGTGSSQSRSKRGGMGERVGG